MVDVFNKGLNDLKLPDFAKELQTGREYDRSARQRERTVAPRQARTPSGINVAAEIIRQQRQQTQLQKALGTGGGGDISALVAQQPTWELVRTQQQGFDQLPFSEQSKLYDAYVASAVEKLKPAVAKLEDESDEAFEFRVREAVRSGNPAPAEPTRTWGEAAGDVARGVGAGAVGLLGSLESAVAASQGRDPTQTFGGALAQDLRTGMSAVEQDRQRQIAAELAAIDPEASALSQFLSEAGIQLGNLSAAGVAELAGNIIPSLGIGAGVGFGARGIAAAAGLNAARAARLAQVAGGATAAALEGASTGGEAAASAYQTMMDMPAAELAQHEDWSAALEQANGDEAAARQTLAQDAATLAAQVGGAAGVALSALPGSLEAGVGAAIARRSGAAQAAEQGLARRAAGLAGTMGIEGVTEASGDVAANLASGQDLLEGAGGSFALGALGGGLGAGFNAVVGGSGQPGQQTVRPNPTAGLQGEPDADPDAPADPVTIAPGETFETDDGATLVWGPEGGWTYGPDSPRTPQGDALTGGQPAPAPADPVTPPADPDFEPVPEPDGEPIVPPAPEPDAEPVVPPEPYVEPVIPTPGIDPVTGTVEGGAERAAAFEANLAEAIRARGLPANALDELLTSLTPSAFTSSMLTDPNSVPPRPRHVIERASGNMFAALVGNPGLRDAIAVALRNTPEGAIGPTDGSRLGYLIRTLGIEQGLDSARDPWALAARRGGDGEVVLGALAADPVVGLAVREAASAVRQAFAAAGIKAPRVRYTGLTGKKRNANAYTRGQYSPAFHTVQVNSSADTGTIVHEMLHGLTYRGLIGLENTANDTSLTEAQRQEARDMLALVRDLHGMLRAADGTTNRNMRYYGNTNADKRHGEMFAEMLSPGYLSLAAQTPLGALSASAQRAADRLGAQPNDTVFDLLVKVMQRIVSLISPGTTLSENSIATILAKVAAQTTRERQSPMSNSMAPRAESVGMSSRPYSGAPDTLMGMSRQPARPFGEQRYRHVEFVEVRQPDGSVHLDAVRGLNSAHALERARRNWPDATVSRLGRADVQRRDPQLIEEVDQLMAGGEVVEAVTPAVPGASQTAGQANAATQQGATNIAGNTPPQSPRTSYDDLLTGIAGGQQATAANPTRGFTQAAKRGDVEGMRSSLTQFGEFLNTKLHDHLAPVKRWFQNLPASVSDNLRQSAINSLYLAPGIRDQVLQSGMDRYGGRDLNQHMAKMAGKYKGFTPESIIQYMGYWITAQRVPTGNRMLIQKDTDRVTEAKQLLDDAVIAGEQAAIDLAQTVYDRAVAQLQARIAAVMNNTTTVKKHGGGGVAGMNNAQARALAAAVEQHFDPADLQAAAELVYDLNAWRLATDIETGKTNAAVAAAFLRQPAVEPLLAQLAAAARIVASSPVPDPAAIATLDAARAQVIQAVRSNYVPLTGDPNTALDEDMFYNGSRQPNVAGDYELTGRTTSVPDDAITSTFASVLKSASYAGWAPFQDAVAEVYNAMPQADREAYGLYRTTVEGSGALLGEHAIVRRRGNSVYAYRFKDQNIVPAIQAANVDTNAHVIGWFGKATRMYAYAATQLNLFFAPKNAIRDFWERSELLRTRTYYDANGAQVDTTPVARRMLTYLVPSPQAVRLFRATGRYAFGMGAGAGSYESRYLSEFLAAGGASVYGDRFARNRTDMVGAILREKGWRKQLTLLQSFVSTYNRIFDLGPALASYIAMREAGMDVQAASGGALDLMNFRKRGENMAAIGAVYAFAQPAITGGANAISALYNPVTGRINPRGWTRLAAYTVAFASAQAFFRSLADDDEGGNRLDQQSDFVQNSHIIIPVGEKGFIKIPLAFGLTRIANGAARALIGAGTGEMTPAEAGGTWFGGSVVPVVSPIEDTDIDWGDRPVQALLTTFFPTWMKPVLAVGLNLTPWGTPVVYDKYEKTDQFRSEQFGKRIPPEYQEIARFLRSSTGVDMAPEEVRALIRGYPLGPGTQLVNGLVENPFKRERGRPTTNPLIQQIYAGYSDTAIYYQFREAVEDTDRLKKRINAGDTDLSERERAELAWRQAWDAQDKELRKRKAAITRSKELSAEGKEQRKAALDRERSNAQTLALYQYRTATGQPAKRVDIPAELAPPAMR